MIFVLHIQVSCVIMTHEGVYCLVESPPSIIKN